MIDLHTHSRASDGALSPTELIELAHRRGLSALALTDHDTVGGLEEAREAAARRGIRFIPGIELEIAWKSAQDHGEFHLLGLGIRPETAALQEALAERRRCREARNRGILEKLATELGVHADYADLQNLSGGGSIGRPHFALLLAQRGLVKTPLQAFDRYLGRGRPLYAPMVGMELDQAIRVIREAGGIAVVAHPLSLYVSWGRLTGLLQDFAAQGLGGIEAWHSNATVHACRRLEAMAGSLGLSVTAGSDFHGEARPDRRLGLTAGGLEIDDRFLSVFCGGGN